MKTKILVLVMICIMCCGCSNQSNVDINTEIELTKQSRNVNIQDKDRYTQTISTLIHKGHCDGIEINIDNEDILENAIIEQVYWFNGSIYAQVNNEVMFRFQLDSNGVIESYIKYELEA